MAQQTISKMETVQTAMSKLFKNLDSIDIKVPDGIKGVYLQMEKEQMHKCASFWRGKENEIEKPIFEQYYNEIFNK